MLHAWPTPAINFEINCVNWNNQSYFVDTRPGCQVVIGTLIGESVDISLKPKKQTHIRLDLHGWVIGCSRYLPRTHCLSSVVRSGLVAEWTACQLIYVCQNMFVPANLNDCAAGLWWYCYMTATTPIWQKKNVTRSVYMAYIVIYHTCSIMFASDLASTLGTVPESSTRKFIAQQTL